MFASFRRCLAVAAALSSTPSSARASATLFRRSCYASSAALLLRADGTASPPQGSSSSSSNNSNNNNAHREAAWTHFASASRRLHRAVRAAATSQTSSAGALAGRLTPDVARREALSVAHTTLPRETLDDEVDGDDGDAALAALAPAIVRRTSTAAASAALMRDLGVIDRVEHRPVVLPDPSSNTSAARSMPLSEWSTYFTRVCQTGVEAQVSSFVILRHLWTPFEASSFNETAEQSATLMRTQTARHEALSDEKESMAPTLQWAAALPAAVRLQLLSHELARVARRRSYVGEHLRGSLDGVSIAARGSEATSPTHTLLLHTWKQCVVEARAVLRCCAAQWLLAYADGSQRTSASALLLSASERSVLTACLQLAAACQSEEVAQQLMQVFLRGVDEVVRGSPATSSAPSSPDDATTATNELERRAQMEAVTSWYETDGGDVYQAAMRCAAQQRTHVAPQTMNEADGSMMYRSGSSGFATAYAYLVHRGTTSAHLLAQRDGEEDACAAEADAAFKATRLRVSGWTAALSQAPKLMMRLLRPLADSVDANADHFNVVLQLYLRLLEETDVAYSADDGNDVRGVFCALLLSLSRVPMEDTSKRRLLEDAYRRTLLNSPMEVVQHPSVLSACLRVCGSAGLASVSIALFNKLAEPASRAFAFREENVAAVCLSLASPSAFMQRILSCMQTKMPLSADVVHAGVASALLLQQPTTAADTTAIFAALDLLNSDVAQNRVTSGTAVTFAERTLFLRLLALLAGVIEGTGSANSGAAAPSLRTPAAAAMFTQWTREFSGTLHGVSNPSESTRHTTAHVAAILSPVTVGALQELLLELQRHSRPADAASAYSTEEIGVAVTDASSQELSPLMVEVRRVLEAVPPPVVTSTCARTLPSSALVSALEGPLFTVPQSLQWNQLKEEWPLSAQMDFMQAVLNFFSSSSSPATSATTPGNSLGGSDGPICMRYQDYLLLDALYRSGKMAREWADVEGVWSRGRGTERARESAATLQAAIEYCMGRSNTTSARQLHVMSALAEVEWWLQRSLTTTPPPPLASTSLPQAVGVPVPPVVGCPSHSWAAMPPVASANGDSTPTSSRLSVVSYWLRRWVDAVEDGAMQPTHSLYRQAVVYALDRTTHVTGLDEQRPSSGDADGNLVNASDKASVWRDGVEQLYVRGPASLLYSADYTGDDEKDC